MRLDQYIEEMDGAPLSVDEFAEEAVSVVGCDELSGAAHAYLLAKREFESRLEEIGVTIG